MGAARETRAAAGYVAGLEPAAASGRRLAREAHRRGLEGAGAVAVLGDGTEWFQTLAAAHCPGATGIVDRCYACGQGWALGRALHGAGTPAAPAQVDDQLAQLAAERVGELDAAWRYLPGGGAAAARDEQLTSFANQAPRMADDRYRAAGWDLGSGMVEGACKHLIGSREKGPGMRWGDPGAHAVAQVRVARFNDRWEDLWPAAARS